MRRAGWTTLAQIVAFGLAMSARMLGQQPELKGGIGGGAVVNQPAQGALTGEMLFAKLVEHNRQRELNLKHYSESRHYKVQDKNDKVRAELEAVVEFHAPDSKQFKVTSQTGSSIVRRLVFGGLLDSETDASKGKSRRDSSITPANYVFADVTEGEVDGYHCFVAKATPTRKDKYLFEGKIWIDSTDFAVVKIEGSPAKNPSFWIKKVVFVRRYQKIGDFWVSLREESVSQVRIVGKGKLTINHDNYRINQASEATLPVTERDTDHLPPAAEDIRRSFHGGSSPAAVQP